MSFTCDESGKILSGTDVVAALSVMEGMGVSAFGLNCSAGPEQMLPQLQRLHKYARVPLIAKPNAGMPEIVKYLFSSSNVAEQPPRRAQATLAPTFIVLSNEVL